MTDEHRFVLYRGRHDQVQGVINGILDHLRERYRALEDGQAIEVLVRPKRRNRSLAQNRLLWWWYKQIADHINASQGTAFSDEEIHEWMKERFLGSEVIEIDATPVQARKSTTRLTVDQMTEYLEQIEWFANERLGLVLPRPEDLWREAMGRDRVA